MNLCQSKCKSSVRIATVAVRVVYRQTCDRTSTVVSLGDC